jgi:hypothetical protein
MADENTVEGMLEREVDKYISEYNHFPQTLLLGYGHYQRLYKEVKPSVLVPVQENGKDVDSVDICTEVIGLALNSCDFEIIVDPDHKHRITFLVSNQFSSEHQAKEVKEAVKKIQQENKNPRPDIRKLTPPAKYWRKG